MNIKASVIIVTYNSASTIEACLRFLFRAYEPDTEIIIVDNASTDATLSQIEVSRGRASEVIEDIEEILKVVASEKNLGFSRACNLGASRARGEYLVFLNPDAFVFPGWLSLMIFRFQLAGNVGAVGPISNYAAGIQRFDNWFPDIVPSTPDHDWAATAEEIRNARVGQSVEARSLIGFCLLISRKAFDEVEGFDNDLFLGNDDLDISWRLGLKGYQLVVALDVFIMHLGHVSFNTEAPTKSNYFAGQSAYRFGEKLLRYYGQGKVPGSRELLGTMIFDQDLIFQPVKVIVFTERQNRSRAHWFEDLRSKTPFEMDISVVGCCLNDQKDVLRELGPDPTCSFIEAVSGELLNKISTERVLIIKDNVDVGKFYYSDLVSAMFPHVDVVEPTLTEFGEEEHELAASDLLAIEAISAPCALITKNLLVEAIENSERSGIKPATAYDDLLSILNALKRPIKGFKVSSAKIATERLDTE